MAAPSTYGDGDPEIDPQLQAQHDAAVDRREAMYKDPQTGLWVQTSRQLASLGACCGRGCRHCPYPAAEQRRAGRLRLRPGPGSD